MAWIEFHAAKIKRLGKFHSFRKDVNWSVIEALGFLGSFWGETIEVCEDGEVTNWTPEYLAELTGIKDGLAERVWKSLLERGWIDQRDEKLLIHDWLDYAGLFLTRKYASSVPGRAKLINIWAIHGRVYGEQKPNGTQTERKQSEEREHNANSAQTKSKSTLPNQTLPKDKKNPPPSAAAPSGKRNGKDPKAVDLTGIQVLSLDEPAKHKIFNKVLARFERRGWDLYELPLIAFKDVVAKVNEKKPDDPYPYFEWALNNHCNENADFFNTQSKVLANRNGNGTQTVGEVLKSITQTERKQ